jgi:hypothetical protein
MKRSIVICLIVLSFAALCFGQKVKPWTEWAKKDAEKMLNGSAWGQTQDDTDASELTYSPTANDTITATTSARSDDRSLNNSGRTESGAKNTPLSLKYRVRFFSAKPIREAFARMIILQRTDLDQEKASAFAKQMQSWIDVDLGDYVIVAVTVEATDRRLSGPVEQALRSATSETLKNVCYLERSDGKRIFLIQYEQPTADQTGAKFVFPRTVDGKPILADGIESVRFVVEFNDKLKINRKYKVADMIYNGKLEY